MKLAAILFQIDEEKLVLPTFQRGYVWNRGQVRNLMRSLYRNYPVGDFLVWETLSITANAKSSSNPSAGPHNLLLDGQQRITSLYGIIRGKRPRFSDADEATFLKLYFNVKEEEFEFYAPAKMKDNPHWINVTELMQNGVGPFFPRFVDHPDQTEYVNRLFSITNIKERDFHIETVSDEIARGNEKLISVVVDIFNEVNSGGTKLSKGDLALAKISSEWPQAREEMQVRLTKWSKAGYRFNLDWLLRCVNALITSHADFAELERQKVSPEQIKDGLSRAETHIESALDLIASRLGLDHYPVLGSPNSIPAIVRYFDKVNALPDFKAQDRLLYWYVQTMLWGRYSGSTETVMRQDLIAIDDNDDEATALIKLLRLSRGDLSIKPQDFDVAQTNSRFFRMLYMLTRVYHTCDFDSGVELRDHLLSKHSSLELHHIFPKSQLRKHGYHNRYENNAVANFTYLTKKTNLQISAKLPEEYLAEYEAKHPGVLASHWIPKDQNLWKMMNYRDFLAARRELLAKAANDFLGQLYIGQLADDAPPAPYLEREGQHRPASISSDAEEAELRNAMDWMQIRHLPRGEFGHELALPGEADYVILDLAWPRGVQEGRSQPVALLIDEDDDTLRIASREGYRCFTSFEELKRYVHREIFEETTDV